MKRPTCPYLGLKEDPTTALNFPSEGNLCHHIHPASPVRASHQARACLTADHVECPVYKAAHPVALPPAIAAPARIPARRVLALAAIPLLLAGLAVVTLGWNLINAQSLGEFIANIFGSQPEGQNGGRGGDGGIGFLNFDTFQGDLTPTPFLPIAPEEMMAPTNPNCPMPRGWITYIVNPTDSLFRLSVIYGIPVEQFQQVNCMGKETVILPGQVIYIPYVPTKTPIGNKIPVTGNLSGTQVRPPVIQLPGGVTQSIPTKAPATRVAVSTAIPSRTPRPTITLAPSATIVPPTATVQPTALPTLTATRLPTNTARPTFTIGPTNTPRPTSTVRPTNTPWWPYWTPRPTRTQVPTRTPVPPTATSVPPTATEPPPPPPTATDAPPPTATELPPPPPTATDAPPPTATEAPPPPPTATEAPPPPPPTATEAPPPPPPADTPAPVDTATPAPVESTPQPRIIQLRIPL